MPAWILIFRIRNLLIPLPWFLLWIILAPFVLIASIIGNLCRMIGLKTFVFTILSESWRFLILIMCLHGTEVSVNSENENILLKFI